MDLGITGRKALICGASKGLGRACAEALLREGVHVTLVARGQAVLDETVGMMEALAAASGGSVQRRGGTRRSTSCRACMLRSSN
jgi:3-oxoacyl-[acyl-carrier protein] reductase